MSVASMTVRYEVVAYFPERGFAVKPDMGSRPMPCLTAQKRLPPGQTTIQKYRA